MARKDLSRTVIEGGRRYYNSWKRRASHGVERASTREWVDRVVVDTDEADATDPPALRRVRKSFHDKLGPAERWLEAQAGRPWNNVYADLCARFDTRTVAGRHVVHDHMLPSVNLDGERALSLYVDKHGILRKPRFGRRSYNKLRKQVLAWADGRFAARTYRGWVWLRREPIGAPCRHPWSCSSTQHFEVTPARQWDEPVYHGCHYILAGTVSGKQLRFLDRLPADLRSQIAIASPL